MTTTSNRITRDSIFICYSHKDVRFREEFEKFARSSLEGAGLSIEMFSDQTIVSGDDWRHTISESLTHCCAAICLVSVDFLESTFIRSVELRKLLERRSREGMKVYLIP